VEDIKTIDLGALRALAKQRSLVMEELFTLVENALLLAYMKQPGAIKGSRAVIDHTTGEFVILAPELDEDNQKIDEFDDTPNNFGRIAAATVRQVLSQRLRDAEDASVLGEFKDREGTLVSGVIQQGNNPRMVQVDLGTVEAVLPSNEQVPGEKYPHGTRLRAYIPLWIGAVLFFMISEQAAGKMATFAESNTDLRLPFFGWSTTAEAYQSVNPAAIVILAPLIGMLFTRRAGRFPSTIMKFAISVLIIGGSAFILGYGFQIWPGGQDLSPWWFLALVYVIQTVAELFLTPVGLATTTALAPKSFASQAMGLWWLSVATGQGVAGFVIAQPEDASDATYYYGLGAATLLMALVLFAVAPWTQRQMADVEVTVQD